MKLTNIRNLGRYKNLQSGKEYNVRKGTRKGRGTDIVYYLYRGTRMIIPDNEFYGGNYEKIKG